VIPGKLAASFGTSTTSTELRSRSLLTTDSGVFDKHQDCTPNLVDGTWKCCSPDLLKGGLVCNAGSSLSPPRIFALPALLFKALSSIPQAIAAAVPSNPRRNPKANETPTLVKKEEPDPPTYTTPPTVCFWGENGKQCVSTSGISSLSIPRIFSLPTFLINLIKQVSSV
jgi:hypothetical protein